MTKRPAMDGGSKLYSYANKGFSAYQAYLASSRRPGASNAAVAMDVVGSLLGSAPGTTAAIAKPPTPAQALKGTKLKRYLDRTYQKKCGLEVKHYEQTTGVGPMGGGTLALFQQFPADGQVAQDVQETSRIGDSIEIKSLDLNFTVECGAGVAVPQRVRMIVLKLGVLPAGTVPSTIQILENNGNIRSGYLTKDEMTIPFTVLKEWDFTVYPNPNNTQTRRDISWHYRPKGCHSVTWTDTDAGGFVANITDGAICMYTIVEGGGVPPTYASWHRLEWVDS